MIIIQTECGSIVTDPKEIYIGKDLEGRLHLYADLSSTDRVKAVELTECDYLKDDLERMLDCIYKRELSALFMHGNKHYVVRMKEIAEEAWWKKEDDKRIAQERRK